MKSSVMLSPFFRPGSWGRERERERFSNLLHWQLLYCQLMESDCKLIFLWPQSFFSEHCFWGPLFWRNVCPETGHTAPEAVLLCVLACVCTHGTFITSVSLPTLSLFHLHVTPCVLWIWTTRLWWDWMRLLHSGPDTRVEDEESACLVGTKPWVRSPEAVALVYLFPVLWRWEQKDQEFKVILSYLISLRPA